MEGSLSGFSLQEVLELLAAKKKTGVLTIEAPPACRGRVWLKEGDCCLAETSTSRSLNAKDVTDDEIKERTEDVILDILDWSDGVYAFDAKAKVEDAVRLDIATILADVTKRQAEWAEIRKEIPTLKAKVELMTEIRGDIVDLTRHEWSMVALIGKSATIEDLQKELDLSPLAACRILFAMSKKGLIRCLGEVIEAEPPAVKIEPQLQAATKKYIKRSLVADEDIDGMVPAEWASYYQLLDSREVAARTKPAARAAGN